MRYRVVYFTELDDNTRDAEISSAVAGEHFYDGFVRRDRTDEVKQIIDGVVERLNEGEEVAAGELHRALAPHMYREDKRHCRESVKWLFGVARLAGGVVGEGWTPPCASTAGDGGVRCGLGTGVSRDGIEATAVTGTAVRSTRAVQFRRRRSRTRAEDLGRPGRSAVPVRAGRRPPGTSEWSGAR